MNLNLNLKQKLLPGTLAALLVAGRALACTDTPDEVAKLPVTGKVLETMNAGNYTYVLVQHDAHKTWAAALQFEVAVGDSVSIPQGSVMKDFNSQTLNRTFDWILFASGVEVQGKESKGTSPSLPPGHPALSATKPVASATTPPVEIKKGSVEKAAGGYTVEECYAKKRELTGQSVKVRGVAVKVTPAILGRNWVHIRDGTGTAATGDLTLTTMEEVKLGDTILVEGKVACDRDFGSGYKYSLLIEDAATRK
jgi:hypothetical protein